MGLAVMGLAVMGLAVMGLAVMALAVMGLAVMGLAVMALAVMEPAPMVRELVMAADRVMGADLGSAASRRRRGAGATSAGWPSPQPLRS